MNPALNLAKQQAKATGRNLFGSSPAARKATARARAVMAARALAESGVIDVDWYSIQAGRRFDGVKDAVAHYVSDVRDGQFPSDAESFTVGENKGAPSHVDPALYSSAGTKK